MKICLFVLTQSTNATGGQTDGRTYRRRNKNHTSTNISVYLENDTRYGHSYYGMRIGNRTTAFEWYHFLWHLTTSNPDFKATPLYDAESQKRYEIHTLQRNTNRPRDLHTPYSGVSFRMTLSDLEWHRNIQARAVYMPQLSFLLARYIGYDTSDLLICKPAYFFVRFSTYENSALIRQPTRTLIFYLATSTKSDDVCDTHCTKLHKKITHCVWLFTSLESAKWFYMILALTDISRPYL